MTPQDAIRSYPTNAMGLARKTLSYRWICLGMLFLGILLAFLVRLAPAIAIPNLRDAFAIDMAQLGLVTSLYMWPFALMQPVAGIVVDTLGPRRSVTIFLVIAGIGQILLAVAPGYPIALLGRGLTGVGFSTLFVGGAAIMAQWFRPREFAFLTGLWTSVANLGSVAATAPLAMLIALVGWRLCFGFIGVAVLALAVLVFAFVRNRPCDLQLPSIAEIDGGLPPVAVGSAASLGEGILAILRTRNTWLIGGYAFTLFGTMTMMQGFFAVPYLMDVYGLGQQQVANLLTLWAAGLIAGCSIWGFAAGTVFSSLKAVVLWGAVTYGLLWTVLAVRPDGLDSALLWLAMFWGGFFAATWIPCYALLRDSVPPMMIATAMGVLNLFFWLGGAVYQQLCGLVLQTFTDASGETPLIAYRVVIWIALASVAASVALIGASRTQRACAA
jgi:sugar phosphate permease